MLAFGLPQTRFETARPRIISFLDRGTTTMLAKYLTTFKSERALLSCWLYQNAMELEGFTCGHSCNYCTCTTAYAVVKESLPLNDLTVEHLQLCLQPVLLSTLARESPLEGIRKANHVAKIVITAWLNRKRHVLCMESFKE